MLGSSKPLASLSSGLLARKGQARPAMRPQGYHGTALNLEDLGWNDMGDEPAPMAIVSAESPPLAPTLTTVPPVLAQREALREEFDEAPPAEVVRKPEPVAPPAIEPEVAPVATRSISAATVARIDREVRASKAKAAFTLRLDADRHLKLRLASASRNRSAQALVTEALDAYIDSLAEVEGLVALLTPGTSGKTSGRKS